MKTAVIYARYSSDSQTEQSIEGQVRVCKQFAEKNDLLVVDKYISHLACGILNMINVFRPEVVMLGGGVSEQGEALTKPLQKIIDAELFGGTDYAPVKIVKAKLGSRAGAFGAAALFMD